MSDVTYSENDLALLLMLSTLAQWVAKVDKGLHRESLIKILEAHRELLRKVEKNNGADLVESVISLLTAEDDQQQSDTLEALMRMIPKGTA